MAKCPGQDQRFWKSDDIFESNCPNCESKIEFWKDDSNRNCPNCNETIANPKIELGCAQWCQYVEQCLGPGTAEKILCQKIVDQMRQTFGPYKKRIEHALSVLQYAEKIQQTEGGDPLVVKAAAILHDIGIVQAEKAYNSSATKYQELEGPPVARGILKKLAVPDELIEHICKIIANHHSAKHTDTTEFRIVWDADWLVNLPNEFPGASKAKLAEMIEKIFKTRKGQEIALELFG